MSDLKRWKKVGGGTHTQRIGGKIKTIKQDEVFKAREWEIPKSFRDVLVCLDEDPVDEEFGTPEVKPTFGIQERSKGWFDIVNTVTGQAINDKALREEEAKEILQGMTTGE